MASQEVSNTTSVLRIDRYRFSDRRTQDQSRRVSRNFAPICGRRHARFGVVVVDVTAVGGDLSDQIAPQQRLPQPIGWSMPQQPAPRAMTAWRNVSLSTVLFSPYPTVSFVAAYLELRSGLIEQTHPPTPRFTPSPLVHWRERQRNRLPRYGGKIVRTYKKVPDPLASTQKLPRKS